MGKMVRKQVYIEQRQEAILKRRAAQLGVTEAELIRQGSSPVSSATTGRIGTPKSGRRHG